MPDSLHNQFCLFQVPWFLFWKGEKCGGGEGSHSCSCIWEGDRTEGRIHPFVIQVPPYYLHPLFFSNNQICLGGMDYEIWGVTKKHHSSKCVPQNIHQLDALNNPLPRSQGTLTWNILRSLDIEKCTHLIFFCSFPNLFEYKTFSSCNKSPGCGCCCERMFWMSLKGYTSSDSPMAPAIMLRNIYCNDSVIVQNNCDQNREMWLKS